MNVGAETRPIRDIPRIDALKRKTPRASRGPGGVYHDVMLLLAVPSRVVKLVGQPVEFAGEPSRIVADCRAPPVGVRPCHSAQLYTCKRLYSTGCSAGREGGILAVGSGQVLRFLE